MPDSNENVPKALQQQMDSLLSGNQAPQPGTPESTPQTAPTEPNPLTAQDTTLPSNNPSVVAPTPVQAPAPAMQNTQAPPVAPQSDDSFMHKYKVLTGKYNAETRELRRGNQEKDAQIAALQQQMAQAPDAQRRVQTQQPATQPVAFDPEAAMAQISDAELQRRIEPKALEDYGEDYWRQHLAMLQLSQPAASSVPQDEPMPSVLDQRFEGLEKRQQQQQDREFFADLSNIVPAWEQMESTPEFTQWKGQKEPMSGLTYGELIEDSYHAYDPLRAATLFETYSQHLPSTPPSTPGLESQVVPETGATPSPGEFSKQTMPLDQWQREMQELTKGVMTPERAREKQAELAVMMREGRVVQPNMQAAM